MCQLPALNPTVHASSQTMTPRVSSTIVPAGLTSTFCAWMVPPADRKISVYVPAPTISPAPIHVPAAVSAPVNWPIVLNCCDWVESRPRAPRTRVRERQRARADPICAFALVVYELEIVVL